MKTLSILRHAKSSWAEPGIKDNQRPINKRGQVQVANLSRWMVSNFPAPDIVLMSPARRTIETFQGISKAIKTADTQVVDELYNSTIDTCLNVLSGRLEQNILLIGHNPGCDELARYVAKPSGLVVERLMAIHFGTATLAINKFEGESWTELGSSTCDLVELIRPGELVDNPV